VGTWRSARVVAVLFALGAVLAAPLPVADAATRKSLAEALGRTAPGIAALGGSARPSAAALEAMTRRAPRSSATVGDQFRLSSSSYGPAEVASVARTVRSLDHGSEMAGLSVYVARPDEVREACGTGVVACYVPSEREMVVSGVDRPVAGVPRDFAIAHEYGHHIANSEAGGAYPAITAGTIRWATYERVCQLTRSGRLFPGNQGAHYWEDPEEAFAQSYAHLADPGARVSWQYTPLLQPTMTSLAKIHADVADPWTGPVTLAWRGSVAAPPASPADTTADGRGSTTATAGRMVADPAGSGSGDYSVGSAQVAGMPPWVDAHLVRTPLDGPVTVSLHSPPTAPLDVVLRDSRDGRVLSRAATESNGEASLSYANCGHASLRLEVRSTAALADFQASISRP
jgi:hypothetical protein